MLKLNKIYLIMLSLDDNIIIVCPKINILKRMPHGIKYSLTLHDRNNTRIFGLDNAHGYKPRRKKYGARKVTWDHEHRMEKIHNYEFESASQLIEDFWEAVEQLLK